jgi:hypothetical protein
VSTGQRDFDIPALYAALDEQRQARGMSWAQAAREMSGALRDAPARLISPSTLNGMRQRRTIEGDGVLQMLRWLQRSPESFLADRHGESRESEMLPHVGPSEILRFDTRALYAALDARRDERGMTWRQVADDIGAINAASLTRLAKVGRIGFPDVMRIVTWLGRPAVTFTRVSNR